MSTVTVQDFANELNRSASELLVQFREAGVKVKNEKSEITAQDKVALLSYLRQKTRAPVSTAAGPDRAEGLDGAGCRFGRRGCGPGPGRT
jgi:translation initiation factor IF-2